MTSAGKLSSVQVLDKKRVEVSARASEPRWVELLGGEWVGASARALDPTWAEVSEERY